MIYELLYKYLSVSQSQYDTFIYPFLPAGAQSNEVLAEGQVGFSFPPIMVLILFRMKFLVFDLLKAFN